MRNRYISTQRQIGDDKGCGEKQVSKYPEIGDDKACSGDLVEVMKKTIQIFASGGM